MLSLEIRTVVLLAVVVVIIIIVVARFDGHGAKKPYYTCTKLQWQYTRVYCVRESNAPDARVCIHKNTRIVVGAEHVSSTSGFRCFFFRENLVLLPARKQKLIPTMFYAVSMGAHTIKF